MPDKVTVAEINSPFDIHNRTVSQVDWHDGLMAADLCRISRPGCEMVFSVNGVAAEASAVLSPGDCVVSCPVPQGDDILRMVAMIAVVAGAAYFGGPLGAYLGFQGATATAVGTAMIMTAGSIVVNAVLPPASPDVPQLGSDAWNESPTYGWGPLRQTEGQGNSIPVLFGRTRTAGQRITSFVETNGQKQYYHVMLGVADGADPVDITDVRINDQPAAYFDEVQVYTRPGGINDAVIPNFDEVVAQQDFSGSKLIYNNAIQFQTGGNAVQRLEIDITAPYGIYWATDSGTLAERSATVKIEYKLVEDETWTTHDNLVISGKTTSAIRKTAKINVSAGQYDVQLTRTTKESTSFREKTALYVVSMREVVKRELIYPGLAKYAVRALATDQLSGAAPRITCTAERSTVRVWNPNTEEWDEKSAENPGWAYYALLNTHHGINKSRILYDEIAAFAAYCEEDFGGRTRFRLSLLLDTASDLWSQAHKILQIGRARPIRRGSRYGVVAEMPATPVQMFSMASVTAGSFKMDYVAFADRANCIEITYQDEDRDYETQTIAVYSDDYNSDELTDNRASKRLFGCPDREQAIAEAAFAINCNLNLYRLVTFGVDIEALATQVGDLFYFNHETVLHGDSGRISGFGHAHLAFDKPVTYNAGNNFGVMLRAADDSLLDKTVYACTSKGYNIYYQAGEPAAGGVGDWWIDADSPYDKWRWDGAAWVDAATYGDDAMDTSIAILNTPFSSGDYAKLSAFDPYTFGLTSSYKRVYRCIEASRNGDLRRTLKGIEFKSNILNLTKVIELPDRPTNQSTVHGVYAHEFMAYTADGTYRSNIAVSWHSRTTMIGQTWELWLRDETSSKAHGPYLTSALDFVFPSGLIKLQHGYTVYVSIPGGGAVNTGDNTAYVTIDGKDDPPPDVTEFYVRQMADGTRRFEFSMEVTPIDLDGYQIRYKLDDEAIWEEMANLTAGLVRHSPWECNELAAGTYVFAIKAVDTSGNESENELQIVAELGDPRLGSVVYAAYPSGNWPGVKTGCWHDDYSGWLIAADTKTWPDFAIDVITWSGWTTWARSPQSTIIYEHPVIDLGAPIMVLPLITVSGAGNKTIEMASSDDGQTYTDWAPPGRIAARYLKFRVAMTQAAGELLIIKTMQILLSGAAITEEVNDLNTSGLSGSYRIAAGHIYLPLTRDFSNVTQVQLALQSVGPGWSWEIIDKTTTVAGKICPELKIYNAGNALADAVIDAYARGN